MDAGSGEELACYLIERVKVALAGLLHNDPRLFQQVVVDVAANGVAFEVEVDVHVLAESRRVVVAIRFSVAKRLQNGVRLQQHVLHAAQRVIKCTL